MPSSLGETRQFSVSDTHTETLREKINAENELKLREQRMRAASMQNSAPNQRAQNPNGNINHNQVNPQPKPAVNPISQDNRVPVSKPAVQGMRLNSSGVSQRPEAQAQRPVQNPQSSPVRASAPQTPVSGNQNRPAQVKQAAANEAAVHKSAQVVQGEKTPPRRQNVEESENKKVYNSSSARNAAKQGFTSVRTSEMKVSQIEEKKKAEKKAQKKTANKAKRRKSSTAGNTVVSVIKAIVYIIFVVILSIFLSVVIIRVANDAFAFVKEDAEITVQVPEYATLDEIATILADKDVIEYPTIFKLYAVARSDDRKFVQGEYVVSPNTSYDYLLEAFKEKPLTGTQEITIPEGYTTDDIINLFVSKGIGTREGFIEAINEGEFDYWFIDELGEDWQANGRFYRLDGYLFPDTYEFYNSSSEKTVINRMLRRFEQIFTKEYRAQCAEMGYSVDRIIRLASMIEKEAASPSEFFTVSSVFHNRLNNPWSFTKLESDATVVYAIAHDEGERRKITSEDLYYNTPYNTYLYEGLPPGPICNPSASAMLAALSPSETDYYYFVSDNGITYFSATKAEHDAYIQAIIAGNSN